MEESKKLYSQNAITVATFFGGPVAAGYLIKKNYEQLGNRENAQKPFFIGIIATLLIFAGIFALPEAVVDKIPNTVIPAVYTIIIYFIVEQLQGETLKFHKIDGGQFYSGWRAAGVGAIFMGILIVGIAGAAFFAGDLATQQADYDVAQYQQGMNRFTAHESEALEVYNKLETASADYLIREFRTGVELWKENKKIVAELNTIDKLPEELLVQNKLLMEYCDLRMRHNKVIIKTLVADTDAYTAELELLSIEINRIIEKITGPN